MASKLPQEILSIIAAYVAADSKTLSAYALVNTSWQAAFEKQIYSSLCVLSPSQTSNVVVGEDLQFPKRGLSLERLNAITSGQQSWRVARRKAVRKILYKAAIPHWLNYEREKEDGFSYVNFMRRENDEVFCKGVPPLFEVLSSWGDKDYPISLRIVLQAEHVYTSDQGGEPLTKSYGGFDPVVTPYCADLLSDCHIATASCIASLDFPQDQLLTFMGSQNGISPWAALKISAACGGDKLLYIRIPGDYPIHPHDAVCETQKAARRMPKIKHLMLSFGNEEDVLEVFMERGRWLLAIESQNNYSPSSRVLQAWKADAKSQDTNSKRLLSIAEYESWPP
ncbi:unnamed protein product [Aureobasidium mustum]|uniref:F-box domain-containing protein n=1 Tax=Aureobasidium mustum TaxID=2773714 RepID=A0A9N8JR66_9PEZI|nr:unnamed protein product [Aureobasidium mustum]